MNKLQKNIYKDKINIRFINMNKSEYDGMNYYANNELGAGYRMREKDIIVNSNLSTNKIKNVIRHELVERKLMRNGMKYNDADKIAQGYG